MYNDNKIKPLHKPRVCVKGYDGQTKWKYFLIEDDDLLKKYNTIWDKISDDIKKEFDNEPAYNKKCLKTKIKYRGVKVTDFYDKIFLKSDSNYICLAVISLDFALKKDDNYYSQVLLKECNYIQKKVIRDTNDSLSDLSSSDESEDFDEE